MPLLITILYWRCNSPTLLDYLDDYRLISILYMEMPANINVRQPTSAITSISILYMEMQGLMEFCLYFGVVVFSWAVWVSGSCL